jgi:purine nucleoside phosphorylase
MLGIISGTILLHGKGGVDEMKEKRIDTDYGEALVFLSSRAIMVPRHGIDTDRHILPHSINQKAIMTALKSLGVTEIIAVNSTGSLKHHLPPGTLVVPDDFINLTGGPTIIDRQPVHITPRLSPHIRQKWIAAARHCGINVVDGGVYWQTTGPRFETRAEIRLMSRFADLVGMTMASEAIIAGEMDIPYASLCSVDNYGHGLIDQELTMEEIIRHSRKNTKKIITIVRTYIERMET